GSIDEKHGDGGSFTASLCHLCLFCGLTLLCSQPAVLLQVQQTAVYRNSCLPCTNDIHAAAFAHNMTSLHTSPLCLAVTVDSAHRHARACVSQS
ncbi:hypothetical protein XENOCAPTIV_003317, partial [Xenoophorus captivus]